MQANVEHNTTELSDIKVGGIFMTAEGYRGIIAIRTDSQKEQPSFTDPEDIRTMIQCVSIDNGLPFYLEDKTCVCIPEEDYTFCPGNPIKSTIGKIAEQEPLEGIVFKHMGETGLKLFRRAARYELAYVTDLSTGKMELIDDTPEAREKEILVYPDADLDIRF